MSTQPSNSTTFFSKSGSIVAIGFGFVALALFLIGFSFGTRLHLLRREFERTHPGQQLSWRQAIASSGGWWGWVGAERYNAGNARARAARETAAAERRRRRAERRKKLGALPVPTFWEVEVEEDGGKLGQAALHDDLEETRPLAAGVPPVSSPPPRVEVSYLIRMPTQATPSSTSLAAASSKHTKLEFQHLEEAVSSVVNHARFADDDNHDGDEDDDQWADLPYVELGVMQMTPMIGEEDDEEEEDLKGHAMEHVEARRKAVWREGGLEGLEGIQRVPGVPTGAD